MDPRETAAPAPDVEDAFKHLSRRRTLYIGTVRDVCAVKRLDVDQLADALNVFSTLLWPRDRESAEPRILTEAEIAATPLLADLARRLTEPLRLVVAAWNDGTVIMTAVPKAVGAPPLWWLADKYAGAQGAPTFSKPRSAP